MRKSFGKVMIAGALFGCAMNSLAADQETAKGGGLTTNSPLVAYLSDPPWLKNFLVVEGILFESGPSIDKIEKRERVNITNRVRIQPNGFFKDQIIPSPSSKQVSSSDQDHAMSGMSDRYYWAGAFWNFLVGRCNSYLECCATKQGSWQ